MITTDNLRECFNLITEEDVKELENASGDYIAITLNVFNTGGIVILDRGDYNQDIEAEQASCGQLYCDCDDFLRLYNESGSQNDFLDEVCL